MTSSGSAYGRFRRALDNGNLLAARASAIELNHVGLAEALEFTLLILAREPPRFRAAALRWHARYCGDNKVSLGSGVRAQVERLGGPPPPLRACPGVRPNALLTSVRARLTEPTRFRAAALRWHARYCGDNKVSIEEATAVLGLLAMLEGRRAKPAAQALAGLLDSRTLLPAAEVLVRWADNAD
jgi:hypothetical protein